MPGLRAVDWRAVPAAGQVVLDRFRRPLPRLLPRYQAGGCRLSAARTPCARFRSSSARERGLGPPACPSAPFGLTRPNGIARCMSSRSWKGREHHAICERRRQAAVAARRLLGLHGHYDPGPPGACTVLQLRGPALTLPHGPAAYMYPAYHSILLYASDTILLWVVPSLPTPSQGLTAVRGWGPLPD